MEIDYWSEGNENLWDLRRISCQSANFIEPGQSDVCVSSASGIEFLLPLLRIQKDRRPAKLTDFFFIACKQIIWLCLKAGQYFFLSTLFQMHHLPIALMFGAL